MIRIVNLTSDVTGAAYYGLLDFAAARSSEFYVIDQFGIAEVGRPPFVTLDPFLFVQENVVEWPGTRLLDVDSRTALKSRYTVTPQSIDALKRVASGLYAWSAHAEIPLPEDLGFLRANGSLVLGTTTHEYDAWLELLKEELGVFESFAKRVGLRYSLQRVET
ncbi:MAG TPA: hypothetical protein VGG64_02125 [Pirellulales bacterium]|jgi:hypothetical protein